MGNSAVAASVEPPANDDPTVLIACFDATFAGPERTVLRHASDKPEYHPAASAADYACIYFANGFFASALHEIGHWCIAGAARRQRFDYGYWYQPDGRDADAQAAFEAVECKPQALEWAFSLACGRRFHVSLDNLGDAPVDPEAFRKRVREQLAHYIQRGLPERAARFLRVLETRFGHRFCLPNE